MIFFSCVRSVYSGPVWVEAPSLGGKRDNCKQELQRLILFVLEEHTATSLIIKTFGEGLFSHRRGRQHMIC